MLAIARTTTELGTLLPILREVDIDNPTRKP